MGNNVGTKLVGKTCFSIQKGDLSLDEEYLYHTLVAEPQIPVRIVLGYNGYASEKSFREGIIEYLETCKTTANERKTDMDLTICRISSYVRAFLA